MDSPSNPLARVEAAHRMLAEARTVDEIKDVRDKAMAAALYAKERGYSLDILNYAAEIKIRAERKAGELLAGVERHEREGAGRPGKLGAVDAPNLPTPMQRVLEDAGITKRTAARWQEMARIPEPEFEEHIAAVKAAGEELTTASVVDRVMETAGDDDGKLARARLKAAVSSGIRDSRELFRLRAEAVADVLNDGDYAALRILEQDAIDWFEALHVARSQKLHLVGA